MQTKPATRHTLLTAALGLVLTFSTTGRADFDPIPLTPESFTHDMIVEKTALAPINLRVTATMDGGTNNNAWTWFEQGFLPNLPTFGLPPQGSTFATTNFPTRVFQMAADYTANNALMVYSNQSGGLPIGLPTGTLTLATPTISSVLSLLVAGGGTDSNLTYTVYYQGAPSETGVIPVYDWFRTDIPDVALNAKGRINMDSGETGNLNAATPKLFFVDINLLNGAGLYPVSHITFTSTNGSRAVIFAISALVGADYTPLSVTGFNRDVVLEKTAPLAGTLANRVNVTMDGGSVNVNGNTWYEKGFNTNAPTTGLPAPGGTISDATRTFTMPASYTENNALYLADFRPTGSLTLATPAAYTGLSFLSSAGNGPLVITVTVHHQTDPDEVFTISSLDWFNAATPIYTAAGRVQAQNMQFNDVNSTNPRLFATNITITGTSPITSIDFARVSGGRGPIFAVSGQTTAGGSFSPVAVTGFNADIVVEASPAWPLYSLQSYTTASMDGGVANTGNTWNEQGYYPQFPACGLPAPGTIITSLAKSDHHYQMPATYTGNNVAFVDSVRSNVNLTLATPKPYSALSFLSATANNNVTNRVIIQYQDGTSETNTFVSRDWFNNSPYAYTARGRVNLVNRHMNNAHTDNPRLYEAEFQLANNVSPVTNIVLQFIGAVNPTTGRMAVLAVSATAGAIRPIIVTVPAPFITMEGSNIVLNAVMGGGTPPMAYQWYVGTNGTYVPMANGGTVTGVTGTNLTFTPIGWTNAADYYFVATNVAGPSTSAVTTVTVRSGMPDVTIPSDPIVHYDPTTGGSPAAEVVTHALDNLTSKYLSWGNGANPWTGPAGLFVAPPRPGTIVSVLRFYTANDAAERDPANYLLEGSRDGGNTFTTISSGALALPAGRNAAGLALEPIGQPIQEVRFANTVGYTSYRLSFSAIKGASTMMQLGEVELLGVADSTAVPTILTAPANTSVNEGTTATFTVSAVGPGTFGYQWYNITAGDPGTPVGQNSPSLVLANVTASMSGNVYRVVVTNEFGSVASPFLPGPGAQLTVLSGPPVVQTDLAAESVVYAGRTAVLQVVASGTEPFTYQWQKNSANLSDNGRISGSQSNILTIASASTNDSGLYQLSNIQNSLGATQSSVQTLTVQNVAVLTANGTGWSLNGTPSIATVLGGTLILSDGAGSTARSAWYNYQQYVGAFRASFLYQDVGGGGADGFTLTMQRDSRGTNALGGAGGAFGYSGITNSASLQFNIYTSATFGPGIAFHTNGVTSTNYTATTPVNLAGGDQIYVEVTYRDGVASISLSNTATTATFAADLLVGSLPAVVGGDTAWVGFTGATGGTASTQYINEFRYVPLPTLKASASGGNVVLSWPASIGGYKLQSSTSLSAPVWGDAGLTETIVGNDYQATAPVGTGNLFYRLVLTP